MLRRNIFGRFRSLFLARAAVIVLALWMPLTLVAACVPIPKDPATNWEALVAFYQTMNGDGWTTVVPNGKCSGVF